jgi:cytochrome c biogenesis protein
LGIFSMFYVRERRLWFWLKDTDHGTNVVMAMSSARKTLDFEKEFVQTRDAVGAALGAKLSETSDAAGKPRDADPPSASSQDSTR